MRSLVVAAAGAAVLLAGCATSKVTLLNDEGVTTGGSVVVLNKKTEAEVGSVTQPNSRARVGGGKVKARPISLARFGALLGLMPPPAQTFVLYFVEGTTDVTPESQPALDALRKVVNDVAEVQITGYTDTVGSAEDNDKLSYQRALEIREVLVKAGLAVASAKVTGRGERDLRTPTADGVSEPTNRRVEIIVR